MENYKIICFYWQGDRWQKDVSTAKVTNERYRRPMMQAGNISNSLASRYVNNLCHGAKKYADRPFDFICFTNEPLEVHCDVQLRPFPMLTDSGVLPRLFMFSPEAELGNSQVLCLDLDVVIVGSLGPLMDFDGLFCTRSKFKPDERHKLDGDIMSFKAGKDTSLLFWDPFIVDIDKAVEETQGRERYWVRKVAGAFAERWERVAPGSVCSYKWHVRKKQEVPSGVSIVSCHGYPRPHQIKDRWIKDYWI